jgi:hypothetical protein
MEQYRQVVLLAQLIDFQATIVVNLKGLNIGVEFNPF